MTLEHITELLAMEGFQPQPIPDYTGRNVVQFANDKLRLMVHRRELTGERDEWVAGVWEWEESK